MRRHGDDGAAAAERRDGLQYDVLKSTIGVFPAINPHINFRGFAPDAPSAPRDICLDLSSGEAAYRRSFFTGQFLSTVGYFVH